MKVELLSYFGDDLMVVNAARVSYGKTKTSLDEKDQKLIRFLIKNKHIAPFRHPQLQFRIECPIFVERQLFKHQVGLCLSGDSLVHFISPSKGLQKTKIEDLYNRWTYGRSHQQTQKDAEYAKRRISGMKLRVLNEKTGIFEIGKIKNIFFSGEKELFEIKLSNGKTIECSKDHRIFTNEGWKSISTNLKIKDMVGCNGVKVVGNGMYRDEAFMSELRQKKLSISEMAKICGCSYHNIKKWLRRHKLSFSKEECCFPKNHVPWNKGKTGYNLNLSEESRKKKSEHSKKHNKKGKDSKWWRGGITNERDMIGSWTRGVASEIHRKFNYTCQKCGQSSGILHAHHIIPVAQDISKAYDKNNLITVCAACHSLIHKSIESETKFCSDVLSRTDIKFCYQKRIGVRKEFKTKVHFSSIVSIKSIGIKKTYDIEVDHEFHNFVANGIVVHNSANSISGRYVDFSDNYFEIQSLRKQATSSKQGSEGVIDRPDLLEKIQQHVKNSKELYKELCEANVAKEQARIILPLSLETQFIWTGSLLAFLHLWDLRLKPDTQQETREIAYQMLVLVKNIKGNPFEYTLESWKNNSTI